jgi:ABC-2 type transport system permease protein
MSDRVYGVVLDQTLREQRRTLMWWSLGLVVVALVYAGGYRQYAEAGMMETEVPEFLDALMGGDDMSSPAGYLNMVIYTLLAPLLVVLASAFAGARAVAGEEEDGMLEVLLGHPLGRGHYVLERFAALAVGALWLGAVVWLAVYGSARFADMGLGAWRVAAASAGLAMLGLNFGALALAAGAATGRRGWALGITAAVALGAHLVNNLAPQTEHLAFLQKLSPFYYYLGGDPLRNGFDLVGLAVLALGALALLGLAVWGLGRRDVAV